MGSSNPNRCDAMEMDSRERGGPDGWDAMDVDSRERGGPEARDAMVRGGPYGAEHGPIIQAVVQTGELCTPYARAGRGPTVLLLVSGRAAGQATRERLLRELAPAFRVIAPEPPRCCAGEEAPCPLTRAQTRAWLRDLVDGLGLARPALVADRRMAPAALAFALAEPERAGPLLVLARGEGTTIPPGTRRLAALLAADDSA